MAWFRRKTDGSEGQASRVHIAEGLWIKCDSCKEIVYRAEVERAGRVCPKCHYPFRVSARERVARSEEHTSELQSHSDLVCRLLLEKKKTTSSVRCERCASGRALGWY